jgi:hypothetical protein
MNWAVNQLGSQFSRATHRGLFSFEKIRYAFYRAVGNRLGLFPKLAIEEDIIFPKLRDVLSKGHITQLNAAALLCALSIRHQHSQYNPVEFLENFLKLYNAKTLREIAEVEEVDHSSFEYHSLYQAYRQAKQGKTSHETRQNGLDAAKTLCWAKDLSAVSGMPLHEILALLENYRPPALGDKKTLEKFGKESLSAFPKEEYLGLLRASRNHALSDKPVLNKLTYPIIGETQCAIVLAIILHARETRRNGESYIRHPMAVANMVRKFGSEFFSNEPRKIWIAMIVAMLHDGGEKSHLDLQKDLKGLIPQEAIDGIEAIHKKDGEQYFEYIVRLSRNPYASFVKLCDLYHNSLDDQEPSIKQKYIYPIAAAYLEYCSQNPKNGMTIKDFVIAQDICTSEQFDAITEASEKYKKEPLARHQARLGEIRNVKCLRDYFQDDSEGSEINADARREEKPALYP